MTTRMYQEAHAASAQVAQQLAADEAQYAALGVQLRQHPPGTIVTLARGSSDNAASYLAYLATALLGRVVASLPMSLITLYRAPLNEASMLAIAISQSGRSSDLVECMSRLGQLGSSTVALVNDTQSPVATASQWLLPLHAGEETSVAATKSFVCSLSACARLVAHWGHNTALLQALTALPEALQRASAIDWSAAIPRLAGARRVLVIGRGTSMAVAQEAALKLKETCGIQAEAFSGAELMHGPVVLVDPGYPVLIFAPRGPAQPGLLALAHTLTQRGADVILAAPGDVAERSLTLECAAVPELDPITAIQSFYGLVEALSRHLGRDPDRPPQLSKVTSTW